jgi:hypothetical protein
MGKEIDLDAPLHPGAVPGLGLGDILKYAPIIEEIVQDVEQVITGGTANPPPIKFKVANKHVTLTLTVGP